MKGGSWTQWGARLRARRTELGYTQVTLARELEVDQGTVSAWERGANIPDAAKIRLARVLGYSTPVELFPWEDVVA